jgi:hypothetical protein
MPARRPATPQRRPAWPRPPAADARREAKSKFMVLPPECRAFRARWRQSRRCGCARRVRSAQRKSCRRRFARSWPTRRWSRRPCRRDPRGPRPRCEFSAEIHGVFGAAIDLGVALLAAIALDLGDGDALDADRHQGVADIVEFERLDDGDDELHWIDPSHPLPTDEKISVRDRRDPCEKHIGRLTGN